MTHSLDGTAITVFVAALATALATGLGATPFMCRTPYARAPGEPSRSLWPHRRWRCLLSRQCSWP